MTEWTCEVCGNGYSLMPDLLKKEKAYHGVEKCGMSTTQQRVTINTVNLVRKGSIRGESFAEALDRMLREKAAS